MVLLQARHVFAVVADALADAFEIGVRRGLERDTVRAERFDAFVNVVGAERDVLDALAAIVLQEFLDLALVVTALVERDADLAARAGHGLRDETGLFALNVEIADLAEVEDALVVVGPLAHVAAMQVVREVVEIS